VPADIDLLSKIMGCCIAGRNGLAGAAQENSAAPALIKYWRFMSGLFVFILFTYYRLKGRMIVRVGVLLSTGSEKYHLLLQKKCLKICTFPTEMLRLL
jgi:hypothetical protein